MSCVRTFMTSLPRNGWSFLVLLFVLGAGFEQAERSSIPVHAADDPVISEFMAANSRTLADEDGDFSDWIEIHNPGATTLDLDGWSLTDDETDLDAWVFPPTAIESGEYLVVFASGKDRRPGSSSWNSVVQQGDTFRYFPGTEQPPANWSTEAFDDRSWSDGASPLGYEQDANGAYIATSVATGLLSLYARAEFTVDDPADVLQMMIHVDYDDGFIAYLNGEEVARRNVAVAHPRFDTPADDLHEAVIYQGDVPSVST